jgi:hypothetical protein
MLTIIIVAVLSAAAGAVTTASLKWGRSALAIIGARIRRDHRTLYGGATGAFRSLRRRAGIALCAS